MHNLASMKGNLHKPSFPLGSDIIHTRDIYRCYVRDYFLKVAKFQSVKNRASSKRLSICLASLPAQYPLRVACPN